MTENDPFRSGTADVICSGDAREMGFAQGRFLRAKVETAVSLLDDLEAFRLQKPKWLPFRAFQRVAEFRAERFLNDGLSVDLPDALVRTHGIAEGSGVRPSRIALLNVMEAVLSDIASSTVVPVAAACSALAVTARSSRTGDPILAHNFDYLPLVQPLYTVRECRPTGRLRSLEFTAAPLVGAVDGMNEAGLCITYNYAYVTDRTHARPTISMWIAEALSTCRNVSEAVAFLKKARRWGGGLLMLGDAEGHIASLELSNTRSSLRSHASRSDRLFHTNRFNTEAMASVEVAESASYSRRAPTALRNRRVHQSSDLRERRFRELLSQVHRLDTADILKVMSDHGPHGTPSADSICMHSDYWHTTASLQLLPKDRVMRVAYDSACRADYAAFAL